MAYIKGFNEFRNTKKFVDSRVSFDELCYLFEEIQNNTPINEENIFQGWKDKIKGFLGNFGNFFSDEQKSILKLILPKKKFSLTPDQLKWVYDYVVKCEGEFTINNFLKVFSRLLKEGKKKQVKEAVNLPSEVVAVAAKAPAKLPPLPSVPKIPNLLTTLTPDSGDVGDVAKEVGDIGISHPEYILFAAVLGLLALGGFKLFNFFNNGNKKINLSDLTKKPNQPDERLEPIRKPNAPDEKPEPIRKPNAPDEKPEPIKDRSLEELRKEFRQALEIIEKASHPDPKDYTKYDPYKRTMYRPNKAEPTTGWWYSEEVVDLGNGKTGWKAYPPTVKPDWISADRWVDIVVDFANGGNPVPKEFKEKGFKFLTLGERVDIRGNNRPGDAERYKMLFENPQSTYKAPGMEPTFLGKDPSMIQKPSKPKPKPTPTPRAF